ncbi:MAG TPA: HAMP domain-containing sensor histidine kinase [Gemmatimonadales bacterium]|nr:HAMP domain-containing sensor histidine kinase [Gemmatimonadales bacterium]
MTAPLGQLRLRLTLWYAGSFAALLLILGVVLLYVSGRQQEREVSRLLSDVVTEVSRAAQINLAEGADPRTGYARAADELDSPDHPVYLFDAAGIPIEPTTVAASGVRRVVEAVRDRGDLDGEVRTSPRQVWRYHAAVLMQGSSRYLVIVLAGEADQQAATARLIELLLLLGGASLVPIIAGGYGLATLSVRPVEQGMRRIRRFTADAAHELRAPVAVIRGRAELTLESPREPSHYIAALSEIAREAAAIGTIVTDLFTLARWEDADRPVERRPNFLDDLADEVVRAASVLARARNVRLVIRRFEETAILGDDGLLRQLLMILLDNAIRFTPPGRSVFVDVHPGSGTAILAVADEGIGIAEKDLPHLFERFYRADAARERGSGAGLGLAIAQRIAAAHEGRVIVTSTLGEGSRFEVQLPLA